MLRRKTMLREKKLSFALLPDHIHKKSLPVRSYLQACKCSEPDAGYSSHKRQLIDQWYERDHANNLSMARKARDFIVQQKLSWEQARNVKRLMANHERAEDAD